MHAPPVLRGGVGRRSVALVFGLALFALGIVCMLESELGLPPWDVLNQGVSERTPLSFGQANVAVSLLVLLVAWALGARIGWGTVANAVLIGVFVDVFVGAGVLSAVGTAALGVRAVVSAVGIGLVGVGSALYIGAAMGAGPRDSLMLVLSRRSGRRIGLVRAALEIVATVAGFALGGTVGLGTVAFALGVGPAVEASFRLLGRTPLVEPAAA